MDIPHEFQNVVRVFYCLWRSKYCYFHAYQACTIQQNAIYMFTRLVPPNKMLFTCLPGLHHPIECYLHSYQACTTQQNAIYVFTGLVPPNRMLRIGMLKEEWILSIFYMSWRCPRVFKHLPLSCFRFQALYNYTPRNEDELELRESDVIDVMEKCDDGWFVGTCAPSSGTCGIL